MKISDNIVFCNQTLQAHDINKLYDIFMFRVDMWRVTVTFFKVLWRKIKAPQAACDFDQSKLTAQQFTLYK